VPVRTLREIYNMIMSYQILLSGPVDRRFVVARGRYAIDAAHDRLAPKWLLAVRVLCAWRRFVFLPGVMITVLGFVLYTGGGAMNVCFSTIALLFVAEIDNLAFHIGMPEQTRAYIEVAGRVRLSELQATELWWSKKVFATMMPIALIAPLPWVAHATKGGVAFGWICAAVVYIGIGLVEELGGPDDGTTGNNNVVGRVARTLGKVLLGLICFGVVIPLSMV
jgi:hypothetical protein